MLSYMQLYKYIFHFLSFLNTEYLRPFVIKDKILCILYAFGTMAVLRPGDARSQDISCQDIHQFLPEYSSLCIRTVQFMVHLTMFASSPWWRHQMATFSVSQAICAGSSPVPGEFSAQRPVTRSFDLFFDLRLNKRLRKQSWDWWSETFRAHYDIIVMTFVHRKRCPWTGL